MNTQEKLEKAKELLINTGWIRCHDAVNASGKPVDCNNEDASKFCLVGALCRVSPGGYGDARNAIYKVINSKSITTWNDQPERKFEDVIKVLDDAIELSKTSEVI